jgi:hypothetical protein
MATAIQKRRITKELRTVTVEVEVPAGVELRLTHKEAITLALILAQVGGDPRHTARRHADDIQSALMDAGYNWGDLSKAIKAARGGYGITAPQGGSSSYLMLHADIPEGL